MAYAIFLALSIVANSQTPTLLEDPNERRLLAARILAVVDAGCVPLENDGHSVYYVNLALDQLFPEETNGHPEDDAVSLRSSLSYATTANYIQINPCSSATMQVEFHRLTKVLEKYGEYLSKAGVTPAADR